MKKITKYAIFNYSKEDEDLINELESYLNNKAESIFDFFDSSIERELVTINLIPTKKEYDEICKKRRGIDKIPSWSIGNSHDNVIEYVSLHDYKNTAHAFDESKYNEELEYYKKTIVHEFVHFVSGLYLDKYNLDHPIHCLSEGLASYLSGQKEGVEETVNFSLVDLFESNSNYYSWYVMTKFIIDNYGKDYFIKLYSSKELSYKEIPRLYEEAKEYYKKESLKRNL